MVDVPIARRARRSPVAEVRAAIGFLTRLPVRSATDEPGTTGAAAFPLVGAAIGGLGAIPLVVLGPAHPLVGAVVAAAVVVIVSGGFHLDGLADTADAIAAPAGAAERARTDPRTGSAGVAAIVIVLGLEVAAGTELAIAGGLRVVIGWIVAGAISRAVAPALAVALGRRHAPSSGLGAWFSDEVGQGQAVVAASLAAAIVIGCGLAAPGLAVAASLGMLVAAGVVVGVIRLRRQLDGDGYGLAIETSFAIVLAACALAP